MEIVEVRWTVQRKPIPTARLRVGNSLDHIKNRNQK